MEYSVAKSALHSAGPEQIPGSLDKGLIKVKDEIMSTESVKEDVRGQGP